MIRELLASILSLPAAWDRFWFTPRGTGSIARVRIAIGVLAAIQFLSFLTWVPQWLSGDGWYNLETGLYMIGDGIPDMGSQYRWSFLYRAVQPGAAMTVCILGLLASIATTCGMGSRWAPLLAWGCMLTIHQRAPWLSLPGEFLIAAGLLYCGIDTGRTAWSIKPGWEDGACRVSANVALRCIQVHFLMWLLFSITSMLQYAVWWNGTAVPLLTEQIASWFGPLDRTGGFGQFLTHAMVGLQVLALLTLPRASTVGIGCLAVLAFALCVGVFAGDWLYGMALVALGLSLAPSPKSECDASAVASAGVRLERSH